MKKTLLLTLSATALILLPSCSETTAREKVEFIQERIKEETAEKNAARILLAADKMAKKSNQALTRELIATKAEEMGYSVINWEIAVNYEGLLYYLCIQKREIKVGRCLNEVL
ncbi:MAG: hypothetical protein ACKOW9_01360 [Candidatus Paceibacterota bacterium]